MKFGWFEQFQGFLLNDTNLFILFFSYCTGIYVDRSFGTCEYFYQLRHILNDSCDYESRFGGIKLRNKLDGKNTANHFHFNQFDPKSFSPLYLDALAKKGHFLMRMLEKRLPKEQFTKVIQKYWNVILTMFFRFCSEFWALECKIAKILIGQLSGINC